MDRDRTYLLIHGGGVTGRFWDRLIPHLDGPAIAADLPGRRGNPGDLATITVEDNVASVLSEATSVEGPIVVVAHSSGGLVVPGLVAALQERVRHVVLNAALVPPEGGCGLDCMKPHHRDALVATIEQAERDGTVVTLPPIDPGVARTAYGGDPLDDDTLAYVTAPERSVHDTVHHYFQPVHWSLVGEIPVTYVVNEHDRPIRPAMQEQMIEQLPRAPTIVRVDSGHLFPVTQPEAFAAILADV